MQNTILRLVHNGHISVVRYDSERRAYRVTVDGRFRTWQDSRTEAIAVANLAVTSYWSTERPPTNEDGP
jgi:hypothetical protein